MSVPATALRLVRRGVGAAIDRALGALGLEVRRLPARAPIAAAPGAAPSGPIVAYAENPEVGAQNLGVKLERVAEGGPFEWPDVVAINLAVVDMLAGARRIAELGGGTGRFAWEAGADPAREIVCSELDAEASRWASEHRGRPNVRYVTRLLTPADGPFDLVVAIEIVEHVREFAAFLATVASLADRAILTTPNKWRATRSRLAGPPAYEQHVREWTAGEFYWVLRCFYEEVSLYTLPEPEVPRTAPIQVVDERSPVIAECRRPLRPGPLAALLTSGSSGS